MEEQNTQNPYESVSMEVGEDAVLVCPNCFEPCNPLDYYCTHCGSNEAINPLTPYIAFLNIRFNTGLFGKLWRKTWGPETTKGLRLIYICLMFLYSPIIFIIGFPFRHD